MMIHMRQSVFIQQVPSKDTSWRSILLTLKILTFTFLYFSGETKKQISSRFIAQSWQLFSDAPSECCRGKPKISSQEQKHRRRALA